MALDLTARTTDGVLLWQVVCEFVAASLKLSDQGFTPTDAWNRLTEFLGVFRLTLPAAAVSTHASEPRELSRW
jgi:hypothetical protein